MHRPGSMGGHSPRLISTLMLLNLCQSCQRQLKRTTWDKKSDFLVGLVELHSYSARGSDLSWLEFILMPGMCLDFLPPGPQPASLPKAYTWFYLLLGNNPLLVSHISASLTRRGTDILCSSLPMIFVKWMALSDRYCISLWSNGELCLLPILMICVP